VLRSYRAAARIVKRAALFGPHSLFAAPGSNFRQ
jgi:hypothetical protein